MEEQELRLIEGLRNGDEHAYHELFVHHYEVLCHVALQIVGDAFLAECLVNDTIAHLWEIRQSLEIRSLLRAYLMRAVRNRCYNYIALESENREIAFSQKKELEEIGNNYAAEENPLGRLLEKELEKEIISSINRLDESCRRVFLKSRFEHKKNDEIAAELGISVNTVKYHIKRALAILRQDLGRYLILPMPLLLQLIEKNLHF